jgi:hypothetical protein
VPNAFGQQREIAGYPDMVQKRDAEYIAEQIRRAFPAMGMVRYLFDDRIDIFSKFLIMLPVGQGVIR